jgi:hypothetical protein
MKLKEKMTMMMAVGGEEKDTIINNMKKADDVLHIKYIY